MPRTGYPTAEEIRWAEKIVNHRDSGKRLRALLRRGDKKHRATEQQIEKLGREMTQWGAGGRMAILAALARLENNSN